MNVLKNEEMTRFGGVLSHGDGEAIHISREIRSCVGLVRRAMQREKVHASHDGISVAIN